MLTFAPVALIVFSVFASVLVGILMNRAEVRSLREDMNRRFDGVERRLELIEGDQKRFFSLTGRMDGRIDELSRR